MFFLERKESYAMPNILDMIKDMDVTTHRIVSNQPN